MNEKGQEGEKRSILLKTCAKLQLQAENEDRQQNREATTNIQSTETPRRQSPNKRRKIVEKPATDSPVLLTRQTRVKKSGA